MGRKRMWSANYKWRPEKMESLEWMEHSEPISKRGYSLFYRCAAYFFFLWGYYQIYDSSERVKLYFLFGVKPTVGIFPHTKE